MRDLFPALYSIAFSKDAWVKDIWDNSSWSPRFVRQLHNWELEKVDASFKRLYNHSINLDSENTMVWLRSKNGNFSVKSFYSSLVNGGMEPFPHDIVWNSWVLVRVSFFSWEANWARILTLDQLKRTGWRIPNKCYMCKEEEETRDHILLHCIKS